MGRGAGVQGLAAVKRQAAAGGTCPAVWTPLPPGIEGILPGRVSCLRNVGTPSGSGRVSAADRPTVRDAEFPGGNRMVQEANAGAPKGDRKPGQHGRVLLRPPWITGRIVRHEALFARMEV